MIIGSNRAGPRWDERWTATTTTTIARLLLPASNRRPLMRLHYKYSLSIFYSWFLGISTYPICAVHQSSPVQPASIGRNAQSQRAAVVGCVRGAHRSINPLRIEWWPFCARFIIIRPVVLVHLWVHKYIAGPYLWRFTRRHNVVEWSGVEVQAGLIRG